LESKYTSLKEENRNLKKLLNEANGGITSYEQSIADHMLALEDKNKEVLLLQNEKGLLSNEICIYFIFNF